MNAEDKRDEASGSGMSMLAMDRNDPAGGAVELVSLARNSEHVAALVVWVDDDGTPHADMSGMGLPRAVAIDAMLSALREVIDREQAAPECDHVCPECKADKHAACDGTAWCNRGDHSVACECAKADHEEAA